MSKMFLEIDDLERLLERNFFGFEIKILKINENGLVISMKQTRFLDDYFGNEEVK